jgi:hypothetical protein
MQAFYMKNSKGNLMMNKKKKDHKNQTNNLNGKYIFLESSFRRFISSFGLKKNRY